MKPTPLPIPPQTEAAAKHVVESALAVHTVLGPGLLEGVYEACLAHELTKCGVRVDRQVALPIVYDGVRIETALKLDLVADDCVIVELKSVAALLPIHKAQVLSYLKLSGHRLALLVNFNVVHLRDGILRVVL